MTDVQKKTLELLVCFINICDKWKIPYYLVSGSALGAVKYRGFIPWDDDIDVALLREDYDQFCALAKDELPEWCFLQNYKTDPNFPHPYSKLRNSNTTFIEKGVEHLRINHGIYIDIFPIDGMPTHIMDRIIFTAKRKIFTWIAFSVLEDTRKKKVIIRNKCLRLLGCHEHTGDALRKMEKLYSKYSPYNSALWSGTGSFQGKEAYIPNWFYGAGTTAMFESISVRIPEAYDAYFTQKYGNWREDPPKEKQVSHHNCIVCDTETPFTQYIE